MPTQPRQSDNLIAWGVLLTTFGLGIEIAGVGLGVAPGSSGDLGLMGMGLLVLAVGGSLLAAGMFRLARHAGRAAGILADYAAPDDSDGLAGDEDKS